MTAKCLINRTPSRVLGMKSPCEMLQGENKFVVPPKLFECVCFVRDHMPSVSKLDPRAVKCIFIGYPSGQQGYKCWSPSQRRTFVSMDVTFRESEPYYGEKTDLSVLFEGLDQLQPIQHGQEGEKVEEQCAHDATRFFVGSIPISMAPYSVSATPDEAQRRWPNQDEEQNL